VSGVRLETPRLLLREWQDRDVDAYARICADSEVMRHMLPQRGITPAEAAFDVQLLREHWAEHGFGHWAVEEKESGRFVGRTGLKHHDNWPLDPDNTEVGYLLDRGVWGRGYATEAAQEAIRYAFEELDRDEVISIARPENAASRRVMEKAGLTYAGATVWEAREIDVVWYSIQRSDSGT
jgi:[ribosomal protein S5]-alanine N-acetyltransferase